MSPANILTNAAMIIDEKENVYLDTATMGLKSLNLSYSGCFVGTTINNGELRPSVPTTI